MKKNFKYSININQFAVISNGLNIDLIDCAIFDYLKDFAHCEKISKTYHEGKSYFYIKWNKIVDDMPMIGINTRKGIIARINNLIECKLLERHPDNQTNGQSMFCFGENYIKMVSFNALPVTQNTTPVTESIAPVTEKLQELILNDDFESKNPVTENPDLSPNGNTPVTDGYHYNTINYNTIKHNVYNSLKEKENFEKKSEIIFIGAKEYKLSYLTTIEKFKEYSKLFKDFDNEILNTRMLEEVSISQYSKEDNVTMSRCFVYEASVKCGSPIKDNSQIEVLADSILKSIKPNANLSWSELSLMTDLSITKSLDHPLFDTQDEIEIPKMFNLHFFNLGVKRYLYFRKNLDSMIQDIKFDKKPYSRSM